VSTYRESIDYLYGLQKHGIKFGLNRTESLLQRVGNPHLRLQCVHVAGTNGKGSTAAMLSSILHRCGSKVGLYTSPHLVRFTERFRINDREVAPETILDVFRELHAHLDPGEPPTFFEMVTAMGLLYFAREKVDWAIVEVGMGGRLDATNVIHPQASVITNVALDHQEFLGRTLSVIAREKAGIIKDWVPVITAAQQPAVQSAIKIGCRRHDAPLYRLGRDFQVRRNPDGSFKYHGLRREYLALRLNLEGAHQLGNAALALATLEVLERQGLDWPRDNAVEAGLLNVHWPARLEILQENPRIVLDGAHNPQGAECLREALKRSFSYRRLHLVLGIMKDKDIGGILRRLLPLAETAIFTKARYERSAHPDELRRLARPYIQKVYVLPDAASAIEQAKLLAAPDDLICVAGSLYFAGEVKELFGEPVGL
jgi:dihydrofolate synthase / folylpolyglutamate synthase